MIDDIEDTLDRYTQLQHEVEAIAGEFGTLSEAQVKEVATAYRRAVSLLEDYRERATGTGDFGGYMEFRTKFTDFVEELAADLPHRADFEAARDHIDRRRLSGRNFDQAREELTEVAAVVETLESLESTREELAATRAELVDARRLLQERRNHLKDLSNVQADALDAPVDALKSPVEAYNAGIEADYRTFLDQTSSRDVLAAYHRLSYFALLDIEAPPSELESFLEEHPAGGEPVPTVREYLDFSRSKLGHYVDDPGHFVGEVGPHSAYLESLTADPFTIGWPPPARSDMQWTLRELIQAVDRFASTETISHLRELRSLCRDDQRYQHLRSAARLRQELDDDERELVVSGAVHDELESVTTTLEAVEAALDGGT